MATPGGRLQHSPALYRTMTALPRFAALAATLWLATQPLPAWALYKVVGPDGKITYTDRPAQGEAGRVTNLTRDFAAAPAAPESGASAVAMAGLPAELRQTSQRFPVTLYTSKECAPCESGRKLLTERGIPFVEKRVVSEEDSEAMIKQTGVRAVPVLMVGGQAVRGWADAEWQLTLDTAGYPRESRLPRAYVPPTPTTVAERKPRPAPRPATPPPSDTLDTPPAPPLPEPAKGDIRF
jgi:glutaredoxin